MRSAPLFALLLTLGCAEKYPPLSIAESHPARPMAYEGAAPDVAGSIASYTATADLDRIPRESARAQDIDVAAPTTTAAPDVVAPTGHFDKGTWFANVYGSAIFGDDHKGEMYLLHAGVGYHLFDYQSVGLDLLGGYIDSGIDDDGGVIGFDAVYRGHFLRDKDDDWTIFFDGGLGLQQASTNFSGYRHFNFRIRAGFGASFEIGERVRAFVGGSYQHISDAGIDAGIDAGGGFDGPMLWAGLTFPF